MLAQPGLLAWQVRLCPRLLHVLWHAGRCISLTLCLRRVRCIRLASVPPLAVCAKLWLAKRAQRRPMPWKEVEGTVGSISLTSTGQYLPDHVEEP